MSKKYTATIIGLKKVNNSLDRLETLAVKVYDDVERNTAEEIAGDAKVNLSRVSTDKGRLVQSINASKNTQEGGWKAGSQVHYAPYVEFGTGYGFKEYPFTEWKEYARDFYVNGQGRMLPSPYLFPAYQKNKPIFDKDVKSVTDKILNRFNKGKL